MFLLQKSKAKASARSQIGIKGIKDGVLMLPGNKYRAIQHVSSINFELKSEDEQDAIIDAYESFLNSVGFPLQILIRTREIDMDKYLDELNERHSGETDVIHKKQLVDYDEFIRSLIDNNKILTRNFYIIIPYDSPISVEFETAKEQLSLSVDIATKGLGRLGMQSRDLSSLEVVDLFYSFYSPEQAKTQPLAIQTLETIHSSYVSGRKYK